MNSGNDKLTEFRKLLDNVEALARATLTGGGSSLIPIVLSGLDKDRTNEVPSAALIQHWQDIQTMLKDCRDIEDGLSTFVELWDRRAAEAQRG